jgi:hypothetical protein
MARRRLVEVRWLDTVGIAHGWQSASHYRSAARGRDRRGRTAGYVLRNDRRGVLIAQSTNEGVQLVDAAMFIPRSAIVRIRRLR